MSDLVEARCHIYISLKLDYTVFDWLKPDVRFYIFEARFWSRYSRNLCFKNCTSFNLFSLNLNLFGIFQSKYIIFLIVKLAYKASKSCLMSIPPIVQTYNIMSRYVDMLSDQTIVVFGWINWLNANIRGSQYYVPVVKPLHYNYFPIFFREVFQTTRHFLLYVFFS